MIWDLEFSFFFFNYRFERLGFRLWEMKVQIRVSRMNDVGQQCEVGGSGEG